jgi:hypothetical protein
MQDSFSFQVESASADHNEHQIGGLRRGGGIVVGQSEMTVSVEAGMDLLATQALASIGQTTRPAHITTRTNHLKCSLHLTVVNIPSGAPSNPAAATNYGA